MFDQEVSVIVQYLIIIFYLLLLYLLYLTLVYKIVKNNSTNKYEQN